MENTVKPKKKQNQVLEILKRFKKNPLALFGCCVLLVLVLLALLAPFIAPEHNGIPGYNQQDWGNIRQLPSLEQAFSRNEATGQRFGFGLFGTDQFGRDLFARIAHGAGVSLRAGIMVVTIAMTLGVTLGAIAGYYSGVTDNVIMRFIDILLAVPGILLAIAIVAALGPGLNNAMIAVGVNAVPSYARQMRAQVITYKEQEFVEAAKACGASNFRIIRRHIMPNSLAPIIIEASMGMAGAILTIAALSFLGIGVQAPIPEWGAMLSDGRMFMLMEDSWHFTIFPGLAIALVIFALNLIGDGLRDALDPKLRSGGFSKKRFLRIVEARNKALNSGAMPEAQGR